MKYFFLILSLIAFKVSVSQTKDEGRVVSLHPSVGNVIDAKEKAKFSLFPEYNDSLFESAQLVKYNDTTYSFMIKPVQGKSFERPIEFNELRLYYNKIESIEPASKAITAVDPSDYYTENKGERKKDHMETAGYILETVFDVLFIILQFAPK